MTEAEPLPSAALPACAPRATLFFESRYRKLVRDLPQTIHWCHGCKGDGRLRARCTCCGGRGRLSPDSVQELISREFLPAFRARSGKFHGAGREDVDVRMLGRGRPFVYEVVGARNLDADVAALRERILASSRGRLELTPFVACRRERVTFWKETKLAKVYRAAVQAAAPVGAAALRALVGRPLSVVQRTPRRVAHRRADRERARDVTVLEFAPGDEAATFLVELRCAHGTYVKEWISGDEGRTSPSLPELLGIACRCVELDVLEILEA